MGVFKQARADVMYEEAQRSWHQGHSVLVVQLRAGFTHTADMSRLIPGMAEQIEAIESIGWRMDRMAFTESNNKPTGYYIFRR